MDINSCRNVKIRQAPIAIHLSLRILYHKVLSCRVIQLIQYPWDCSFGLIKAHTSIYITIGQSTLSLHDDVIKWKHFPRYWPFVRGIHRSPVNSPHKGQWRGALMYSLIWAWTDSWANDGDAGDLRRYRAHYHVIVMRLLVLLPKRPNWDCCMEYKIAAILNVI